MAEFEQVSSGASTTVPAQCSSIKKNGFVCIKGKPCKVVETSTSKTGKHGGAKVHMVGIDLFTGKKYEEICPSTHNMDVPVVTRTDYTLLDINEEGFVTLMTADGSTKEDLRLPDGDLGAQIRKAFEEGREVICCVTAAMGQEAILACKESGGN